MQTLIILLTALLPVAILVFYICYMDRNRPEPPGQLIKAFFFGILSVFLSLCISIPAGYFGLYSDEPTTTLGAINSAFCGAAIPEEIAKFVMLWLLLRKNRHFDENFDGIVYAVLTSLGFAALENVMYLFSNSEEFLSVGIVRALFAVPGHFCDGVLMGYYYSLIRFSSQAPIKNRVLVLLAPIIAHGIYDALLMTVNTTPAISGLLIIAFIVFCRKLWKHCRKNIKEHLMKDDLYGIKLEEHAGLEIQEELEIQEIIEMQEIVEKLEDEKFQTHVID
jgi:RsiW-degrading membrane proteinase PrsW (M82 family)